MARLSYQAIESLWVSAGGSKALAPVMAAIAYAESGGNPAALNNNAGTEDYSVGLWQINYFGSMMSGRTREFGSPSALLASPTAQARAAVAIYRQQGLGAWSTYTSGAYRKYLNGNDVPAGGSNDVSGGTATDASDNATAASYKDDPNCLVGFDIPVVGGVCLLTKGQARAILGALLIGAGGIVTAGGLIILAAYGLKETGALGGVAKAAQVIPGAGGLAARAVSASGALKAGPKPRRTPTKGAGDGAQ